MTEIFLLGTDVGGDSAPSGRNHDRFGELVLTSVALIGSSSSNTFGETALEISLKCIKFSVYM